MNIYELLELIFQFSSILKKSTWNTLIKSTPIYQGINQRELSGIIRLSAPHAQL